MEDSLPSLLKNSRHLESLVRKALFTYNLLEGVDHLAVALSGGKDSLTLLLMLHAIQGRGAPSFKLSAIHVEGVVSCGAGVTVKRLSSICEALQVPLIIKTCELPADSIECYSCSRERRKLIFSAAKEMGATTIAFGHHQDDLNQTALMNLLHKGQFEGLLPKVPMIFYGVTIIRPLILTSEAEIITFAKENGFQRLTCQCPHGQNSMRKKTEQLIKMLEEVYPHARVNLARAVDQFGSKKALLNPGLSVDKVSQEKVDTLS